MTLAEAIAHAEERAHDLGDSPCAVEHQQLKEWLQELEALRGTSLTMMKVYGLVARAVSVRNYPETYRCGIQQAVALAASESPQAADRLHNDLIDLWHDGEIEGELHDALAMTSEEYAAWAEEH
jgi:hypothetical protein